MALNKALFLDRDGVINHDPGDYTKSLEEFQLLPDALHAMRIAAEKGYQIIIITNQGGIAKGLYGHETVEQIHGWLDEQCRQRGFALTGAFYCPHHPDFGNCLCRKPGSLLLEKAIHRFSIDPARSFMIGDRERDTEAAAGAGVKGFLIESNSSILDIVLSLS